MEPLTDKSQFIGVALLRLAQATTNDQLTAIARDIKIAAEHGDVTEKQRDVLYAVGKMRREELNDESR